MEQPIRVLQVLAFMNMGGAETMIMNYYRNIDRKKVQFDFLLHRSEKGAYDDEIRELGGNIFYMPSINPIHYFKYKKCLKNFFNEHPEYKIVHSHLNSLSAFVLNAAKKTSPIRIAHSHIAINPITPNTFLNKNQSFANNTKDLIQAIMRKPLRKSATHYFSCGIKAGAWMYGKQPTKHITVINNAIDIEKFSFDSKVALEVRNEFNLSDSLVIGHVGRFHDQKNHTFIIKIFAELLKINSNSKLVLIGVGELKSKVEEEVISLGIKDNVLFLGARKDIPRLMQGMDIFLFPSLFEGLPVTLVEAQASGLKIFCSDKVSDEVVVTDLIDFVPLEETASYWANKIIEGSHYLRTNTQNELISYDIKSNSRRLEEFYLSNYKE